MHAVGYSREWYAKHKERLCKYQRARYAANKAKMRQQARARYLLNREKLLIRNRANYRKAVAAGKRYGREYPTASRPCPKRCECCGSKPRRALSLDHCHRSKKFRGWLCTSCNAGIGMLGDTVRSLKKALAYLEHAQ